MSHDDHIPEAVREYVGHDKVALFGRGGRPAPPAPPDSPARKHGELAVREALAAIGTPNQPGERPAAVKPPPSMSRRMRSMSEQALMEASMRKLGSVPPAAHASKLGRALIVPVWSILPWGIKRALLKTASGVKGWQGRPPSA